VVVIERVADAELVPGHGLGAVDGGGAASDRLQGGQAGEVGGRVAEVAQRRELLALALSQVEDRAGGGQRGY
jgi:hypothetical protein